MSWSSTLYLLFKRKQPPCVSGLVFLHMWINISDLFSAGKMQCSGLKRRKERWEIRSWVKLEIVNIAQVLYLIDDSRWCWSSLYLFLCCFFVWWIHLYQFSGGDFGLSRASTSVFILSGSIEFMLYFYFIFFSSLASNLLSLSFEAALLFYMLFASLSNRCSWLKLLRLEK